jgi:hypothetical protein
MKNFLHDVLMLVLYGVMMVSVSCSKDEPKPEPPILTGSDFTTSIGENPEPGLVIGTLDASTTKGDLTFTIVTQSAPGALVVNALSGEVSVGNHLLFDYEEIQSVSAVIEVSDGHSTEEYNVIVDIEDLEDVIVVGSAKVNNTFVPAYWLNGNMTNLSIAGREGKVVAVANEGDDIYMVGWELDESGKALPLFWKNDELTQLPRFNNTLDTRVRSLYVKDGVAHIAGQSNTEDGVFSAVSWTVQSGIATPDYIPSGLGAIATGIAKPGSKRFMSGHWLSADGIYFPGYWIGEDFIELPANSQEKHVLTTSISASGGDIIISGYEYVDANPRALGWQNGEKLSLSEYKSQAYGSLIHNGQFIFYGFEASGDAAKGVYWINGTPVAFSDALASAIWDMVYLGDKVFVLGELQPNHNTVLWKNGAKDSFWNGSNGNIVAHDMVAIER